MADTYVLVHGAWHTGETMEATAQHLRARGHTVHCPTLPGNHPGDGTAPLGLQDAIDGLVQFLESNDLKDVRLVGHSYGGMLLSGAADRVAGRIRRLVYVNAFVPLPGEALCDMVPPYYRAMFEGLAAAGGGGVQLPYEVWRECFINDADAELARSTYAQLHAQPLRCLTDPITLSQPTAALALGKSYLNCREDTALPHSLPWHPRLSERLGLFRYVEASGSHEALFTDPEGLALGIERAGRD